MTPLPVNNKPKKIKAFFLTRSGKKALTFSFFIIVAFCFWLLQYLQQRFEMEINIPVHYENVPDNVVLDNDLVTEIKVKISDKGTALLNYSFLRRIEPIVFNLNSIDVHKSSFFVSEKTLEKKINECVLSTSDVLVYTPDNLKIDYQIKK